MIYQSLQLVELLAHFLNIDNNVLVLNSLLPQGITLPINVPVQTTEEMVEERLFEKSKVR